MAKCSVCNTRKGKRKCHLVDGMVCPLCCGQARRKEKCQGCRYYKEVIPRKNYNQIPSYSTKEMESDPGLQVYSDAIEGALCAFDNKTGNQIKDEDAIRILELLLDRYYFKEEVTGISNPMVERGFNLVKEVIETDLEDVSEAELSKVLGVIRFVAGRRGRAGRDYLTIINTYVGERVGKGIRAISPQVFE